ncbi:reverse transcriptase domain-containing protein [Tanacetum coccineum]|uniref:Reverse transcriptase domain-containing protein n=1 Tax=Tanacetum coccineum TaxID=301880 RepID=A0ABQ5HCK7_9ASTR
MPFGLCNAPVTFQRCMIAIFHEIIEDSMEAPIMIKPDWSLPFEVMCDASDYVVRAVLGQRINKHFKPIHYASKTINEAQGNYTATQKELFAVVFAIDKFRQYLVLSKTIIRDKKGAENQAADNLSRLENPDLRKLTKAEIRDLFHEEWLMAISDKNNKPWYADYCAGRIIRRCVAEDEVAQILRQCHSGPSRGHHGIATTARKDFKAGFYWPHIFCDANKSFGLLTDELRNALSIEPPPHLFKKKSLIAIGVIMELQNGMCVWPAP